MSIRNYLNTEGQNAGRIHGNFLAIDTAGTITKSYTTNGSILLTGTGGGSQNLDQVLQVGNDANFQDIINVNSMLFNQTTGTKYIAIGENTDYIGTTNNNSVSIGNHTSPQTSQGMESVSIGLNAGSVNQSNACVAIGVNAGNSGQGADSVCIGAYAGSLNVGASSVCIGTSAGYDSCGQNSILIGSNASPNFTHDRCIVLNANANDLNTLQSESCYVRPIRTLQSTTTTCSMLYHNSLNNEITRNNDKFVINGINMLSATASGSSGQHLNVVINGTNYKIALLNV